MPEYKGSCFCKRVKFVIKKDFSQFHICHCHRCQKSSSSAFTANLFANPESIEWKQGLEFIKHFELNEEPGFAKNFCSECGSSLPFETMDGKILIVPAGILESKPNLAPEDNIFWKDHAGWEDSISDAKCFDEYWED
jgi:hypothetical protein